MSIVYQMQGLATGTQQLVSWPASYPDRTGAQAPVPVTDVVVYSTVNVPAIVVAIACAITSPIEGAALTEGTQVTVTGTISAPGTVLVQKGAGTPVAASVVGLAWSYTFTLLSADVGAVAFNAVATATSNGTTAAAVAVNVTVAAAWKPSTISNLLAWQSGRADMFTDTAGTTPAVGTSARVRRMNEIAPLTGNWQSASAAQAPFIVDGALQFDSVTTLANGTSINSPTGVSLPANGNTIAISFELWIPPASGQYSPLFIGNDGQAWGPWLIGSQLRFYYNAGSGQWIAAGNFPFKKRIVAVFRTRSTGITLDYTVEGVEQTQLTLSATINAGTATGPFNQSIFSAGSLNGKVSDTAAYSRAVTDAEVASLLTNLYALASPPGFPINCPLVAVSGDSISVGIPTTYANGMVAKALPTIWGTAPVKLLNAGIGGTGIVSATSVFSADIAPAYSSSRVKNILLVEIGTNDLGASGRTAAAQWAAYKSLCDTAKAQGWLVILFTMLPRSDAQRLNTNWIAERAAYNTLIRNNASSYADLCDLASVSGMGADGDELNTTNYADKLHPTAVGYSLLAPTISAAVLRVLAAP